MVCSHQALQETAGEASDTVAFTHQLLQSAIAKPLKLLALTNEVLQGSIPEESSTMTNQAHQKRNIPEKSNIVLTRSFRSFI